MGKITRIESRAIADSRGIPTIAVTIWSGDECATAEVPSGKSAGTKEARELRDPDGVGVSSAILNVHTLIRDALIGTELDPEKVDQTLIDLDGTPDKSRLGGNTMLGVSIAAMRLAAASEQLPAWRYIAHIGGFSPSFPRLYMNMLNGGVHASFRLPFQEYIAVIGGSLPSESYTKANAIFKKLGVLIGERFPGTLLGDEGGYSPNISGIEEPFALLSEAVGGDTEAFLAIDAAASEFFREGTYHIEGKSYTSRELMHLYEELVEKYPIQSIEDPFAETDLAAFREITRQLGGRALIIGDDLTVTNPKETTRMIGGNCANGLIIKPNQVGTLLEVFETVRIAKEAGWQLIASHRSGETEDAFIADLAVGIGAYGIKAGAPTQAVRRAKYERLVEIEKEFIR